MEGYIELKVKMWVKWILPFYLLTLLPFSASAVTKAEADSAYVKGAYQLAIADYEALLKQGASAELYYNLGNAYYRTENITKAVLNYERALLLDPSNSDARFNLDFVRSKMQLPDDAGDSWFSNWVDQTVSRLSSNAWAMIAIITFLLFLAGVAAYLFMDNVLIRKIGFFPLQNAVSKTSFFPVRPGRPVRHVPPACPDSRGFLSVLIDMPRCISVFC